MYRRALLSLSLSALVLGGTTVGCAAGGGGGVASAGSVANAPVNRDAARDAGKAGKALAKGNADAAIRFAERAVALAPSQADYRLLLGQSYLKAGRFGSARQAFADTLVLAPDNGRAGLNLALAQTALGDWAGARRTLDSHQASIPTADRGLAMALAGDPVGAVEVLTAATRSPDAGVKTRQNLALAMALAGRWQEAKAVAATDLSPADVDARIMQWAAFARPASASDQVSALLGVVPVVDAGQPSRLALAAPVPAPPSPAAPARIETAAAEPAPVPAPVADERPVMAMAEPVVPAPRPAPAKVMAVRAPSVVQHAAAVVPRSPAGGDWYVQFGAYENAGVARDGWARAVRRDTGLRGHAPLGVSVATKAGQFYRLSIGGFARSDAEAMCRTFKTRGGTCFVRPGAGEQVAAWAKRNVQVASR